MLGINTFKFIEGAEGLGFAISGTVVQGEIPTLMAGVPADLSVPPPTDGTPNPALNESVAFGPLTGQLAHDTSNDAAETQHAKVLMTDMMVEATFTNPYGASENLWTYGFVLRDGPVDKLTITVSSARRWRLHMGDMPTPKHLGADRMLGGGTFNGEFDDEAGGQNHLRMVAIGDQGWFFINGAFVASIDLSLVSEAGDVAVVTGASGGDEMDDASTGFRDFKGKRLTRGFGPVAGVIEREDTSNIGVRHSGVSSRDGIVEAVFMGSQAENWDYGVIFRNPSSAGLRSSPCNTPDSGPTIPATSGTLSTLWCRPAT